MKVFILAAAALLGLVSVEATSLRRREHATHQAVLQAQEHVNAQTHACKKGDCKTTKDIVTVFEEEWAILSKAYNLKGFRPTFQAGTAITFYGCRDPSSSLSDFDMWERNIIDLAKDTDLEAIAGAQSKPKVPLDVRKTGGGKVLGFEILLKNVDKIVTKSGEAVGGIAHEYDIWDGYGPGGEYEHLTGKTDITTPNGVEFSVISCKDLITQKSRLAGMTAEERAHGLEGGEALGRKKLAQDKADVECIEGLLKYDKVGPCDPTWVQKKISKGEYDGWPTGGHQTKAIPSQSLGHQVLHRAKSSPLP